MVKEGEQEKHFAQFVIIFYKDLVRFSVTSEIKCFNLSHELRCHRPPPCKVGDYRPLRSRDISFFICKITTYDQMI